MFTFIVNCLKRFGIKGLLVYLKIKLNLTDSISVPGLLHPISMRPTRIDNITFREIFIRREYDIDLPPISPTVIIDAGANIGFTSVFFANRYPNAKIYSLEPDTTNFRWLEKNTKPYPNITPVNSALWHTKEMIQVVDHGYGERGFMIEKKEGVNSMQAVSMNDLMDRFKFTHIDILKIDIEGSEKEVFSSAFDRWLSVTKVLVIELHDRMKPGTSKAVFQAVSQYDFSFSMKGENLVFIHNSLLK